MPEEPQLYRYPLTIRISGSVTKTTDVLGPTAEQALAKQPVSLGSVYQTDDYGEFVIYDAEDWLTCELVSIGEPVAMPPREPTLHDPECIAVIQKTLIPHLEAALAAYAESPKAYRDLYRVVHAMNLYPCHARNYRIVAPSPQVLDAALREGQPLPLVGILGKSAAEAQLYD